MAKTHDFCRAIGQQADPTAIAVFGDIAADLAALRAAIVALTAKLDADTVSGLDDDYAATCDPAALRTVA